MRIRIIKSNKRYNKGETVDVSKNVAFGLIDSGFGMISKDIVQDDLKVKEDDGRPTDLRPVYSPGRKRTTKHSK